MSEIRRKQAENLLRENQLSINEISERLGYADISHFSRAFKKNGQVLRQNFIGKHL